MSKAKMDAEMFLKMTEIIRKQSEIMDELYTTLCQYTDMEDIEKKIEDIRHLRNSIEEEA